MAVTIQPIAAPKTVRRRRGPSHRFYVAHNAWVLQPIVLAPVLAGETLTNLLWKARAVSLPVANPLIGWHLEYYWFYVPFSKFSEADYADLQTLMLDPAATAASVGLASATASAPEGYYGNAATVNWLKHITSRVVEDWFRDEGELASDYQLAADKFFVSMSAPGWAQSLYRKDATIDPANPSLTVGVDDVVTGSEVEDLLTKWQMARMQNLTPLSYEEWLEQQGVRTGVARDVTRVELLRVTHEWTYPSNTIDPTSGAPKAALSWSVSERADKTRFFKEPGFVVGYTVARPKVYWDRQKFPAASLMNSPYRWLPLMLNDDYASSLAEQAAYGSVDVNAATVFDLRDLLLYGDQFTNHVRSGADGSNVSTEWNAWGHNAVLGSVPGAAVGARIGKYPAATDPLVPLFGAGATAAAALVIQDGVADLSIQSRVVDGTP